MPASRSLLGVSSRASTRLYAEVARRSFHRYSTYRGATFAGVFTNTVFGFLQAYVLLAVVRNGGGEVRNGGGEVGGLAASLGELTIEERHIEDLVKLMYATPGERAG